MLRNWEMAPVMASEGLAALHALEEAAGRGEPFFLVLLDATMPEMDGYGLAAAIQARSGLSVYTLMMLSAADRA